MTITLMNMSTGKEEAISLCNQDLIELFGQSNDVDKDTLDMVNIISRTGTMYVSDVAYHELAKVCREMPRQYRLREQITNLTSRMNCPSK